MHDAGETSYKFSESPEERVGTDTLQPEVYPGRKELSGGQEHRASPKHSLFVSPLHSPSSKAQLLLLASPPLPTPWRPDLLVHRHSEPKEKMNVIGMES